MRDAMLTVRKISRIRNGIMELNRSKRCDVERARCQGKDRETQMMLRKTTKQTDARQNSRESLIDYDI